MFCPRLSRISSSLFFITFSWSVVMLAPAVSGQTMKQVKSEYYTLDGTGDPIGLYVSSRGAYLVTTNGIYKQEQKKFLKKFTADGVINCALEDDSVFWLGTQTGLVRVNKKTYKISNEVTLPVNANQPRITTILKDYAGAIWVGAEAYGVFKFTNGSYEKVLGAFPVNAGTVTPDSSVWIGTNTGLYRWKNKEWVRYNEEGVTNYEIPDNIVDRLLVDNNQNLWIVLSEGITVFETKPHSAVSEDHVPSVKFIGKPQNPVYEVAYIKNQGYVFATGMGLLFLPDNDAPGGHLAHLEQSGTSDIVQNKQVLHPIVTGSGSANAADFSSTRLLKVNKNKLWLVDQRGVRVIPLKNFVKLLPQMQAK